jgi:hypothetical protein
MYSIIWFQPFDSVIITRLGDHGSDSGEVGSRSADQKVLLFLYNPKVRYHTHKSSPLSSVTRQMNSMYFLTTYRKFFLKLILVVSDLRRGLPSERLSSGYTDNILCPLHTVAKPSCQQTHLPQSPGFILLEIHEQDLYSLLDMYVFRNGASSSTKEGSVFLFRCHVSCTVVSARPYPRCHSIQITVDSVYHCTIISNMYSMYTEVSCQCRLVQ